LKIQVYLSEIFLYPFAMKKKFLPAILAAGAGLTLAGHAATDADALLAQMTLDEKIGQMVQVDSAALHDKADVKKYFLGSVLSGGGSDPADNSPATWKKFADGFQAQALQTRLKIPLLYGIDAVHGNNNVDGAVIFPHHVGLGAAHDAKLVERAERVTAEEVAGIGIRWAFAPCIAGAAATKVLARRPNSSANSARRRCAESKARHSEKIPCLPVRNILPATVAH
jgi:hypothetical protein